MCTAQIIALNLPLALLFAFGALYARDESANLLSIGAVDFGIIIDSTVIMVENIYRVLSTRQYADLPLGNGSFWRLAHEVERSLFVFHLIMVCACYRYSRCAVPRDNCSAHGRDLCVRDWRRVIVALTIAPVLCLVLFRHLKPVEDNFFVRFLKHELLEAA